MKQPQANLRQNPPAKMTLREAAIVACVSYNTLRRWVNTGELPAARIGRKLVIISREDLFCFIDAAKEGVAK